MGFQTFTNPAGNPYTFTATVAGVHKFQGNGGGAGGEDGPTAVGGGIGGAYREDTITLAVNDTVTINIGAGSAHAGLPGAGGDTSAVKGVTTVILAPGGGSGSAGVGVISHAGGAAGASGVQGGGGGGGGGGPTGAGTVGSTASDPNGGAGGAGGTGTFADGITTAGTGGRGGNNGGNAANGTDYGAGGGGAGAGAGTLGSNGRNGVCVVSWTDVVTVEPGLLLLRLIERR